MESNAAVPVSGHGDRVRDDRRPDRRWPPQRFGDAPAVRHKVAGAWRDVSYAELGDIVSEVGRGLIDLGHRAGRSRRRCCAARGPNGPTRDFGITTAGAVAVPIYPTNSPEECEWVAGDSESRAIVCEDAAQVAKIAAVRERLPDLETIIVIDPAGAPVGRARSSRSTSCARAAARGTASELERARRRRHARGPVHDHLHVRHDRPAEGLRPLARQLPRRRDDVRAAGGHGGGRGRLPLPPPRALVRAAHPARRLDLGKTLAYFGGDPRLIVPELSEVRPTYMPVGPAPLREALHARHLARRPGAIAGATKVGLAVRALQAAGQPVPGELQAPSTGARSSSTRNVRAAFGGRMRQAVTGAAPIAPEILEFFFACGVPVIEGYGMTETADGRHVSTLEHPGSAPSAARCPASRSASPTTARSC